MNANPWSALSFVIVLPPRGQARARAMALTDKAGNVVRSKHTGRVAIVHHKDKRQEQDEDKLQGLMLEHRPERPLNGPILIGMKAYLLIPQSKSAKWKQAALNGEIRPEVKPDLDNILKHVKDCAKGIFWVDDKQVVGYLPDTGKYYGDPARYEITILYRQDRQNEI